MKLLRIYPDNLTVTEDYMLTVNETASAMRDCVGQTLPVKAMALLERVDETSGEVTRYVRVLTDVGECYGTSSKSFVRAIETAWDFADRREVPISALEVKTGRSKAGRDFLTCVAKYSA